MWKGRNTIALCVGTFAAAAVLAQDGAPDIRGRGGGGPGNLPPLRREAPPPEADQRSPGSVGRRPQQPEEPRPRPEIVPEDRGSDPIVTVQEKGPRQGDSVGTAFAIDRDGNWVTAQHVVDECRVVYVFVKGDWLPVNVLATHPVADVAVMRTRVGGPPVEVGGVQPLSLDQDGFQFGFPQFRPGATHVKLLGRVRVSRAKRGSAMEVAYSWAEMSRKPDFEGTLGGISGGPIFNSQGAVVGVNILESSRRGRVTTSSPTSIREALSQARVQARDGSRSDINPENYEERADAVRASFAVVRVFCAFRQNSVPPRARAR